MEVVLDTSAWINITDSSRSAELNARLRAINGSVAVPKEVLAELLAQSDPERAWAHLQTMIAIDTTCIVRPTRGFGGLTRLEQSRSRMRQRPSPRWRPGTVPPLAAAPQLPRKEAFPLVACFQDRKLFDRHHAEMQRNASWLVDRSETLALDKRARQRADELGQRLDPLQFRRMIATTYPARLIDSPVFSWLIVRARWRHYILRRPHLFCSTLLWGVCQELSAWGIGQAKACPGAVPWLESVKKNTWRDNKIAASAAYADYLVTDDVKLVPRVSFAAQALGLRLRSQSLDHFLSGARPLSVDL